MQIYTATAPILPMVTFRRVAVVLSALVIALATYLVFPSDPPNDGGQNCQSDPAHIARSVSSSDMQLCMPDTILPGEYPVVPPQQK